MRPATGRAKAAARATWGKRSETGSFIITSKLTKRVLGERAVDQRDRLMPRNEIRRADAEHRRQLFSRDFQRPGRWRRAWRRLRIGGRARGMEAHPALDLLDDL